MARKAITSMICFLLMHMSSQCKLSRIRSPRKSHHENSSAAQKNVHPAIAAGIMIPNPIWSQNKLVLAEELQGEQHSAINTNNGGFDRRNEFQIGNWVYVLRPSELGEPVGPLAPQE